MCTDLSIALELTPYWLRVLLVTVGCIGIAIKQSISFSVAGDHSTWPENPCWFIAVFAKIHYQLLETTYAYSVPKTVEGGGVWTQQYEQFFGICHTSVWLVQKCVTSCGRLSSMVSAWICIFDLRWHCSCACSLSVRCCFTVCTHNYVSLVSLD
jgi:hypothetical protein